jgi:quinoprotein glucose dehydrogenase
VAPGAGADGTSRAAQGRSRTAGVAGRAAPGTGGAPVAPGTVGAADDWPIWGADAGGTKYSRLDQINRDNVGELVAVWSWQTGEQPVRGPRAPLRGEDVRPGNFEATPLVIDGVMYLSTPYNRVVALDAASGAQLWAYDPRIWEFGQPPNGTGLVHRGVALWEGPANADGSGEIERRIFLNSRWRLIVLDAATGEPIESFGPGGEIDLTEDLIWPTNRLHYTQTSPPVIYGDLVILGNGVGDRLRYRNDPPGDIQAFDVRSGERVWRFSPIPQAGELGNDTWEDDSWSYTGHTNVWAPFTLDDTRGLLYLPVGTPSNDYWGGHRKGDNLFAESILCLNAATGERVWHFQTVHHGLWDYDVSSPPTLLTINVDGRAVDAVAQPTKQGFLFVFDRVTGEPVWPIEERPVPASDAPGERSAATQPFPTRPAPFARQGITEADLMGYTPELKAMALEAIAPYRWGEMFLPPSTQGSVVLPGLIGGANYGGAAADIETGVIYVKASNSPSLMTVVEADPSEVEMEYTGATGTPRLPNGLPLLKPPYGTLTAIDLNSGEHVWQVPVGDDPRLREHPALSGIELPERLGAIGHSGPIVTAGGLVFISGGASTLYAFDAATGEELWSADLGAASGANPMTFTDPAGRQLVVIASGRGSEAKLTAFALANPSRSQQ